MIIQSKKVWLGNLFREAQVEIKNGKISGIYPYESKKADTDYGDLMILPGFIDIHTHGAYGYDTNDGTKEGMYEWARRVPSEGVTSFLATTVTQHKDVLKNALRNVSEVHASEYEGAEILGVHFEGPFLNKEYKGAQPEEAIQIPTVESFIEYQEAAGGLIKYITLAPEKDENCELIRYLASNGVTVSLGHSAATFDQALEAKVNGASSFTHVYNGMSPFRHREPGLVGAALLFDDMYGEIIADGHHSALAAISIFFKSKGKDYGIIVTDSLRVKDCEPGGRYELGGHEIEISDDGLARLKGTDTIAGSTLHMNEGLRIAIKEALVPVESAINACTINPARAIGVGDYKGKIQIGYDADIVVLDEDYVVCQTYCRGRVQM